MSFRVKKEKWSNETLEFATREEADAHCDAHFLPKLPLPMPDYEPLIVVPKASKHKRDSIVAFIEKQLCFFEYQMQNPLTEQKFDIPTPEIGKPIEVMITRALYHRYPEGHEREGYYNFEKGVRALMLCPVDPWYTPVYHNGFECSGSMCSTTASEIDPKNPKFRGRTLTPGRTGVYEADNVNAGSTWKQRYRALRPGKAFIFKDARNRGVVRIEGIASYKDAEYAKLVKTEL